MRAHRFERAEDEALVYALAMHDEGYSFEQIGAQLDRDPDWARRVCLAVFAEEAAHEPRH